MTDIELNSCQGYAIPCRYHLKSDARRVVLICHGFGSSRNSPTAEALAAKLTPVGLGWLSFDFPAHGDSPVDGDQLSITNCLNDIAVAEEFAAAMAPQAELCYFGSSFGSYVLALYLALRPHRGRKAMLRCAAVTMPELLTAEITPRDQELLDTQGYAMAEQYGRPLKITREFVADLKDHDAFQLCHPGMAELLMIHGTADETAPLEAAHRFAKQLGARLIIVPGAGHRFQGPGETEQVMDVAREFFMAG